jgi:putative copper resistance protein D
MAGGLIASRFVQFSAVMIVFGSSLFALYCDAGPDWAKRAAAGDRLDRWLRVLFRWNAAAAAVSALGWLLSVAAEMRGDPASAVDSETIWIVLLGTHFGRVWQGQLTLSLLLAVFAWLAPPLLPLRRRAAIVLVCSAALLVGAASVGHAAIEEGLWGVAHLANHALHLMAGGAWVGGLLPLGIVLYWARASGPASCTRSALRSLQRFSAMGMAAMAALIATGFVNSWFLAGRPAAALGTNWGRVLLLKLGFFVTAVGFAAVNRLWLVPNLVRRASHGDAYAALAALCRNVSVEQLLAAAIVAAASLLGTLPPPR